MNKHIRSAVEEAILDVDVISEDEVRNDELSKMYIPDCFAERFAELIIQKCVSQVAMIGVANWENEDISWAVQIAIKNIREHFGIEK